MCKEIGSFFYDYQISNQANNPIIENVNDYKEKVFFSSGRNAILKLIKIAKRENEKKVLLPSFTCETVIEPFIMENFEIKFYDIKKDLTVNIDDFFIKCKEFSPNIILMHGYFGFDTLSNIRMLLREMSNKQCILVEDITQCLFSNFPKNSTNYVLGSLRKWFAIPDGGFLASYRSIELEDNLLSEDSSLVDNSLLSFDSKKLYIKSGLPEDKNKALLYFDKSVERIKIISDEISMSNTSKRIYNSIDVKELKIKRSSNFKFLLDNFPKNENVIPVFKELKEEIVPLYFPIYVLSDRDNIQKQLSKEKIYCPIVWPKSKFCSELSEEVNFIYENILCLPCDQRYDIKDMERIITRLKVVIEE